jgi:hypothetical protein
MGFDPMTIGSAATFGVLDFGGGPALWLATVGILAASATAIALSGLRLGRIARLARIRLAHAHMATAIASRAH